MLGIKSQDVVVLLKLASLQALKEEEPERFRETFGDGSPPTVRGLEAQLGISKSEINASFKRSLLTGLAINDSATGWLKPHRRNLHSFIIHGLKYVFPAEIGPMTRGVPTAFAAPMLKGSLASGSEYIYVWPYAEGRDLGQSVRPLFRSVPEAAQKDERLYELLALVDSVRLGNQREAGLAGAILSERLLRK